MTDEQREKNLELYVKKLGQVGVDTSILVDKYGELLKNGSFTQTNEFGNAFDGRSGALYALSAALRRESVGG